MVSSLMMAVLASRLALASSDASLAQSTTTETLRVRYLHRREKEHEEALARLSSNMTTTTALDVVLHKSAAAPDFQAFIQTSIGSKRKNLRSGQLAASESNSTKYDGLEKAKKMLNEMIEESQEKYDLEIEKCCQYDEYQSAVMEECRQDISKFNAEAAEARACVLDQNGIIEFCEGELPRLKDLLEDHNTECNTNLGELRRLLKIVISDIEIMNSILKIIGTCPGEGTTSAGSSASSFLMERCMADGEESDDDGCSYIQIDHGPVQTALSQLKSDEAKQLVQDNLLELHDREEDDALESTANTSGVNTTTTWAPETLPRKQLKRSRPCKTPKATDKKSAKCSLSQPNCLKMKEKFEYIRAGMQDKQAELETQQAKLEKHCQTEKENMEAQINQQEQKLKDAQNKLAVCTGTANFNDEQSRLKSVELVDLLKDYNAMTKECHKNYQTYEGDICAIKKIRTELYKVKGNVQSMDKTFWQDCVVGEWVPGECSTTCGTTGQLVMERKIVTAPVGGAQCPALKKIEPCNRKKCPIDCKLDEWSGWSSCTAKCGGGVTERNRDVLVEPEHGGEPCGETSESTSCNIQACDKDCVLRDWSAWSSCSKECNGGHIWHGRTIAERAIGNGKCPKWYSKERLQRAGCNMFACKASIVCNSVLDVMLVIDGSGSLGSSGWAASKKAGAMLARAFGGGKAGAVKLSVVLFSYYASVIQHFTDDAEAVATKIEGMAWPRSLTYTARALWLARNMLQNGRPDADSVVIVITDGRPMSWRNTYWASWYLRKQARLMWVPVTRYAPLGWIRWWASWPQNENIVQVQSFSALETPAIADKIISNACPNVI